MEQPYLQHDIARLHEVTRTTGEIQGLGFFVLDHPPHSPDSPPSDFRLFPKLKEHSMRRHYAFDDKVRMAVRLWFRPQDTMSFSDGLMKLVDSWRKSVEQNGVCVCVCVCVCVWRIQKFSRHCFFSAPSYMMCHCCLVGLSETVHLVWEAEWVFKYFWNELNISTHTL
jgi:hypothetical protein